MFVNKMQKFYDNLSDINQSFFRWAALHNPVCPERFLLDILEEIIDEYQNKEYYISVAINIFQENQRPNNEFQRINKVVIENMKEDFEKLDGIFLDEKLIYVARNYKIFL